ncbi:MAG: hypothetical protein H7222_14285 [Methylotenera sp.]|nr:hypothetical protein [Oligoflexia bacterium]
MSGIHSQEIQKPPRTSKVVCLLFPESSEHALSVAEACYRFTPLIALRRQEAVFLELTASWHLFEKIDLLPRLHALCRKFELAPRIALAQDAPTALALSRHGSGNRLALPLEALADYADPFIQNPARHELIQKKVSNWIPLLRSLGVHQLKDFLELPERSLASRFGMDGLELYRKVKRNHPVIWPSFHPQELISEKAELFDSQDMRACVDLESLLFILRELMPRALSRLRGKGHKATVISLEMELDDHTKLKWQLQMPVAQGSVTGILPLIQDRLGHQLGRTPLSAPALWVEFTILESVPGLSQQRNFFSAQEHSEVDPTEAWESLLGRLTQKLGKDRAFTAQLSDCHLPEKAWTPFLSQTAPVLQTEQRPNALAEPCPEPHRPLRLLREPLPLSKEESLLTCVETKKIWHITGWQGPERILSEWWDEPVFTRRERDYYRVFTAQQEELWVFKMTGKTSGSYFLHGYFD